MIITLCIVYAATVITVKTIEKSFSNRLDTIVLKLVNPRINNCFRYTYNVKKFYSL